MGSEGWILSVCEHFFIPGVFKLVGFLFCFVFMCACVSINASVFFCVCPSSVPVACIHILPHCFGLGSNCCAAYFFLPICWCSLCYTFPCSCHLFLVILLHLLLVLLSSSILLFSLYLQYLSATTSYCFWFFASFSLNFDLVTHAIYSFLHLISFLSLASFVPALLSSFPPFRLHSSLPFRALNKVRTVYQKKIKKVLVDLYVKTKVRQGHTTTFCVTITKASHSFTKTVVSKNIMAL